MRVCPRHHKLIGKYPVPSHLGIKLPATPAPPAPVTDTGAPKNPIPDHASGATYPTATCLCANWLSTKSGDELYLWHLPLRDTSLHNRRDVHTLSMNCNCGESAVFCIQRPSTCRSTTKVCQRPYPGTSAESRRNSQQLQLWETTVSSTLASENLHDPHNEDSDQLVRGMQLRKQFSPLSDQSPVICSPTGMSTTNPELRCGIRVFCTVCTVRTGSLS